MRNVARQQTLDFRRHGGKRKRAGRKAAGPRPSEPHRVRKPVDPRHPLHVTIRACPGLRLRRRDGWRAVRGALVRAAGRSDFRICHVSIQATHIHLIVEADSTLALARGMQGFQISCARRYNAHQRRKGQVFADRYHPVPLSSLKQVHHALGYVLNNWRRHGEHVHTRDTFDPFASARAFDGWAGHPYRGNLAFLPVVLPTTWHLTHGWRRYGTVSPWARPGPAPGTPVDSPDRRG